MRTFAMSINIRGFQSWARFPCKSGPETLSSCEIKRVEPLLNVMVETQFIVTGTQSTSKSSSSSLVGVSESTCILPRISDNEAEGFATGPRRP